MKNPIGEQHGFISKIKPSDIKLAAGIDIEALRESDSDPLEVVVSIPASKSKRGWNYTKEALGEIVDFINNETLSGFLGHQKAEEVPSEFPTPATHWIGAEMKEDTAYIRGIIDASQTDLKRWIRTGRIKEVSIFGYPELEKINGEIHVKGYKPLSIDWTPLHRPGMATEVVSMEMEDIPEGEINSTNELHEKLSEALRDKGGEEEYPNIVDILIDSEEVVYQLGRDLFKVKFVNKESTVELQLDNKSLTEQIKVTRTVEYQEVEMEKEKTTAAGEMSEDIKNVIGEMTAEELQIAVDALKEKNLKEHESRVERIISEKVAGETAQLLVGKMINAEMTDTDEMITSKVDEILKDESIKKALGEMVEEQPAAAGASEGKQEVKFIRRSL